MKTLLKPRVPIVMAFALMAFGLIQTPSALGAQASSSPQVQYLSSQGASGSNTTTAPEPVIDHGGPVLATTHVYLIWWGPSDTWPSDAQPGISSFYQGLNGSSYVNTATQYLRGESESVTLVDSRSDQSVPRAPLSAGDIGTEIANVYGTVDPDGYYVVYTSNHPTENRWCAWHSDVSVSGLTVPIAYLPNFTGEPECDHGNIYSLHQTDTLIMLADFSAHEFMETVTDPHVSAWYDQHRQEIGDKCDFKFGGLVTLSNATTWQLQEEWSNATMGCMVQTL